MRKHSEIVQDAIGRLSFEINPHHVAAACRLDKQNCVIAQALKTYPGLMGVEIGARHSFVAVSGKKIRYETPTILRDALNRFDATGEWGLKKGTYHLNPPMPCHTLDAIRKRSKTLSSTRFKDKNGKRYKAVTGRCKKSSLNPRYIVWAGSTTRASQ